MSNIRLRLGAISALALMAAAANPAAAQINPADPYWGEFQQALTRLEREGPAPKAAPKPEPPAPQAAGYVVLSEPLYQPTAPPAPATTKKKAARAARQGAVMANSVQADTLAGGAVSDAAARARTNAFLQEIRIGLMNHNTEGGISSRNADKEEGLNFIGEVVLRSPQLLAPIGKPRPVATASLNNAGGTNYGAMGLEWNIPLVLGASFDPSLGYALHTGKLGNPFPAGSKERGDYDRENLLLGSRDLFRFGFGLSVPVTRKVGVQFYGEHLSHGNVIGAQRNNGLDNFGARLRFKLDGSRDVPLPQRTQQVYLSPAP